ncbi:SDR family oxidoreductase [Chitinimonas sp. BJYL2]|uniref:SDR family NAD(P)-dependent oxidoreductase n=1 Tax=Chitinimonas sp. BJYL2 TaxID=2976696 RepID=UPI0022B5B817|nr:SDR family NAD(P)-dependent oxidoreductase [Chitinimonas sp. BJYL2]
MARLNPPITDWQGKRVWLIGASSGIGAALASQLLARGARVVLSARDGDRLATVAAGLPHAHCLAFDAAQASAWPAAATAAHTTLGGLDLVVFLAARYDPCRAWEADPAVADQAFQTNVLSIYRGVAEILPGMLQSGQGGIALVASVSGYTGLPQATIYGATKAALINLAESLYFDLAPKGVSVYLVNPGFVATPMTAGNPFTMPELITPEQAATAMLAGFARGEFEIRFPRRFTRGLRWLSRLPYRWRFPLLHKVTGL